MNILKKSIALILLLVVTNSYANEHLKHVQHKGDHPHKHGNADCQHPATVHDDHTDYTHDGHTHHEKDAMIHECAPKKVVVH